MPSAPGTRWGIAVFVLGIALLLAVLFLCYHFFSTTARVLGNPEQLPANLLPPLSRVLAEAAVKLGGLIAMGYISSLIAARGLSLYGAAREVDPE